MTISLPQLPIPKELQYHPDKLPGLLLALSETPVLLAACKANDIHPTALEVARMSDSLLDQQINWAMKTGVNIVEERIAERALGQKKPIIQNGRQMMGIDPDTGENVPLYEIDQSDAMLKKFAERLRPDLYGDKVDVNHDVKTTVYLPADVLEDDFEKMLAAQKEKTDAEIAHQKAQLGFIEDDSVEDAQFEEVDADVDEFI